MERTNIFQGPSSVRDFLNPQNHPLYPLVELPNTLNPYRSDGVRIFAKLLSMTPLSNVKSLAAYSMIESLDTNGKLLDVDRFIESSSGNTVFSLALTGRAFGVDATTAYVSRETSPKKLSLLRFMWVDVTVFSDTICPNPSDPESSINRAERDGDMSGRANPGQYRNHANPDAHFDLTGPQIYEQTGGKIDVFCAGLGTTGTMVGTMQYLRSKKPDIVSVGVVRAPNNPIPGPRTQNLLRILLLGKSKEIIKKTLQTSKIWIKH